MQIFLENKTNIPQHLIQSFADGFILLMREPSLIELRPEVSNGFLFLESQFASFVENMENTYAMRLMMMSVA